MIRVNVVSGQGYVEFDCPRILSYNEISEAIEKLEAAKSILHI